jgi:uncharacterized protein
VRSILADTGPLVALFLIRDANHQRVKEFAKTTTGRLVTTWPVFTEVCFFLNSAGKRAFFEFIATGALEVVHIEIKDLAAVATIIERYRERDIDVADASLLWLAEQRGLREIITIDRKEFESIYRVRKGKRFFAFTNLM